MPLVLHAGSTNKYPFKALIAAEYSGVKVKLVKDFEMGVSNKTPEFMKMNPIGKVPVLETPDGPVFESNAIARYVTRVKADNPLYGSSLIEYVSGVRIVWVLKDLFVASYVLKFAGFKILCWFIKGLFGSDV
uniref:GST N-terminal domain-containing protein n=1 Tax=Quercus lobata TaxID=97700 RepID=A0A7N2MGN9_QUELO